MPLTTIEKVKSYLQIPQNNTMDDEFIKDIIDSVQDQIENYCNRKFDKQTYTEIHSCRHKCFPKQTPILSIQKVLIDGGETKEYKKIGNYIELCNIKKISISDGIIDGCDSEHNAEFTYVAGYDKIPADLRMIATKLVALEYKSSKENRLGLKEETEGDVRYVYDVNAEMSADILKVLDRYKKVLL